MGVTIMVRYELIEQLAKKGLLDLLLKAGFLPTSVSLYKEVFETYNKERAKGEDNASAVLSVSVQFNISERYVYRIVQSMKKKL